jgi:hypothetical protein
VIWFWYFSYHKQSFFKALSIRCDKLKNWKTILSKWEWQEMWIGHCHEIHLKCSFGWLIQTQYYIMVKKKSMLVEWWSLIALAIVGYKLDLITYFFQNFMNFSLVLKKSFVHVVGSLFFVKWWNFVTIKNASIIVI